MPKRPNREVSLEDLYNGAYINNGDEFFFVIKRQKYIGSVVKDGDEVLLVYDPKDKPRIAQSTPGGFFRKVTQHNLSFVVSLVR